jgi:hypothetical protein
VHTHRTLGAHPPNASLPTAVCGAGSGATE